MNYSPYKIQTNFNNEICQIKYKQISIMKFIFDKKFMQIGRPSTSHVQSQSYIDEASSQVLGQSGAHPSNLSRGSQNLIAWMHQMTKGTHALPALT